MTESGEAAGASRAGAFLHLTDLHFWQLVFNPFQLANKRFLGNLNVAMRRRHEILTSQAPEFVRYMSTLGVADVVLTGDFTSTSTHAEFRQARAFVESLVNAGMRPVVFSGNHDVYTFESERKHRFEEYLGEWMPASTLPTRGAIAGGTPILYVPTARANLISSRGRITPNEVDAVRELLRAHRDPLIVAAHYPLLDRTYGYEMTSHRRLCGAGALREALGSYAGRLLYVAGHVHRFSHVIDPTYPFVNYLTSGALFRRDRVAGHTGEFSEVRVGQGGFRVFRHQFSGAWSVTEHPPRGAKVADGPSM